MLQFHPVAGSARDMQPTGSPIWNEEVKFCAILLDTKEYFAASFSARFV